jgi:hypothetical protein
MFPSVEKRNAVSDRKTNPTQIPRSAEYSKFTVAVTSVEPVIFDYRTWPVCTITLRAVSTQKYGLVPLASTTPQPVCAFQPAATPAGWRAYLIRADFKAAGDFPLDVGFERRAAATPAKTGQAAEVPVSGIPGYTPDPLKWLDAARSGFS